MDAAISVPQTLQNGFWPSSRFAPTVEDKYMDDGIVREEYAEDAPFVGRRHDRPPSFCVAVMYMLHTFLRCDRQMAICTHSGLLVQSAT
jgi:hypothetical protein